jgi:MFS family permease
MELKGKIPGEVFLNKSIITVYISSFLILMNLMVSLTLFPLFVKYRGGSDFMIGLQSSIFTLSSIVLRLYFGPLADSVGRKFPLLLGAFAFGTAPVLVWLSPNFFIMSLARIYQAVGMATFLSAASSSVSEMVPNQLRGTAIGLYRSLAAAAVMVGPFLGYRLIDNYGYSHFFISVSASSLFALLLLIFVKLPDGAMKISGRSVKPKDLISLIKENDLKGSYIGIILTSLASGIVLTFTAVYFTTIPGTISPPLFFSIYAIFGMMASTLSGYLSDRLGRSALVTPLIIIFGLGLIILGSSGLGSTLAFYIAPALIAIGYSGGITNFATWIVDIAPDELRASALSFQESSIDIGNTIGILLFGILASSFYYGTLFICLGLIVFTFPYLIKVVKFRIN